MISYELDENTGVLIVRPEGKLEAQDFLKLSGVVDPFIEERGGLNGIIIVTEKFPGWKDFNGMIEHMRFVRNHHRKITKVAIVTDSKVADVAESLGKHFVKASVKHFSFKELESAKGWMLRAS
jgi:hypothetical protein